MKKAEVRDGAGRVVWELEVTDEDAAAILARARSPLPDIPQAALSHPNRREALAPVLCTFCKEPVCMCDREPGAMHPACRERHQEQARP